MKERDRKKTKRRVKYLKSLEDVPVFKTEEEEIEFWKSHSLIDIIDKLPEVEVEVSGELKKKIEEHKKKKLLTIRLYPAQIEKAKQIAIKKGIGYLTLMRNWIQEGIDKESYNQDEVKASILPLEVKALIQPLEEEFKKIANELERLFKQQATYGAMATKRETFSPPTSLSPHEIGNPLGMLKERIMRQGLH